MSPIVILFFIVFISMAGFGLTIPLMPSIKFTYHLNNFQIGILGACFPLAQFFSSPILGALSDKWGRRQIIYISFLLMSFSFLVLALANSFAMIMLSRFIGGFFSAALVVSMASAADISTHHNRVKYMGILGMGMGFGFAFGPTIGGFLAGNNNHSANIFLVAIIAFIVSIIATILAFLFLPESNKKNLKTPSPIHKNEQSLLEKIFSKKITVLNISLNIMLSLVFSGFEVFTTIWCAEKWLLTPFLIGIYWAIYSIMINVGRIIFIQYLKGYKGMSMAFLLIGIFIFGFIFAFNIWLFYLFSLGMAMLIGFLMTMINSKISLHGSPEKQGLLFGINNSAGNVGRFLGPFLLGNIYQYYHIIDSIWVSLFIFSIVGSLIAFSISKLKISTKE